MKKTLKDIKVMYDDAMLIMHDNTIAINTLNNHSRTKHIYILYHFLREKVSKKEVRLEYMPTKDQSANIFTKALVNDTFKYLQ